MLELKSVDGKPFRCLITNSGNITLLIDGKIYNVDTEFPFYNEVKKAIEKKNLAVLKNLLDVEQSIKESFNKTAARNGMPLVEIKNGTVYYRGEPLHNTITARILEFKRAGLPFEPLLKFLENLMQNPSKRAVDELYGFLCKLNIPISSDGCFLAYKSVKSNYYDKYTGTILNSPGSIIEIPRNSVDDDCNRTCSNGIHCGSLEYSGPNGWYHNDGDKVVVVKVNPRDAVSVPTDHDMQKLRVCRYEVVRDFDAALDKPLYEANNGDIREYDKNESNYYDDNCGDCDDLDNDDDDYCGCDYDCDEDDCSEDYSDYTKDTRDNYKTQKRDKNGRFVK